MLVMTIEPYCKAVNQGSLAPSYVSAMKQCEGKRVLTWGEERNFPYNPSIVCWQFQSQPLMWTLTNQCATAREIRIKLKQMNVDYLLWNPLCLDTQSKFAKGFDMDARQSELFHDFCVKGLRFEWAVGYSDYAGTYELYKII